MPQIEVVSFDCDGTLVDSKAICSRAYTMVFRGFGIRIDLEEIFTHFKDIKLYEIINIISKGQGVTVVRVDAEYIYRVEVARLFDAELEDITEANELLVGISVPIYVVSNGPISKIQYSLGKLSMLCYFPKKLSGNYDIQRWKPDPVSMLHAAKAMNVNVENCILVDDSSAGAQPRINVGIEMFHFCADPHNKPIIHLKAATSTHLPQLLELWKTRGWDITAQLFIPPSLTSLKLAHKGK